jgi:epsilon-lactone hydrolase
MVYSVWPVHDRLHDLMPSWQARLHNVGVRAIVRRRSWGDERSLTRRARLLFGAPPGYRSLAARGVRHLRVHGGPVRGEWLIPDHPSAGILLYVHGGGFVSCSAASHRPITAALARFTSRRVFSLDYRLAPEHRFPAAPDDVLGAYEWLMSEAPNERIALAGDSAGANLVIGLAVRLRDLRRPSPACVVAFSPWTDLAASGASARQNDGHDVMFHYENLAEFAAVYLGDVAADRSDVSPVFASLAGLPPVLLHVGSTEILLDDARCVDEAIRHAGGSSQLTVFDDVAHCWQMLVPLLPEASASLKSAASFITSHLSSA